MEDNFQRWSNMMTEGHSRGLFGEDGRIQKRNSNYLFGDDGRLQLPAANSLSGGGGRVQRGHSNSLFDEDGQIQSPQSRRSPGNPFRRKPVPQIDEYEDQSLPLPQNNHRPAVNASNGVHEAYSPPPPPPPNNRGSAANDYQRQPWSAALPNHAAASHYGSHGRNASGNSSSSGYNQFMGGRALANIDPVQPYPAAPSMGNFRQSGGYAGFADLDERDFPPVPGAYTWADNDTSGKRAMASQERPPPYSPGPQVAEPASRAKPVPLAGIEELNILILGETGVGKSTFINAFVNYLTFGSLEEALETEGLACVIPSAFTWQSLENDDYVSKEIKVEPNTGVHNNAQAREDEKDGLGGQSATQVAKIYPVTVGKTKVRLIDTPGIGDTRGMSADKKNMDNIMKELHQVGVLHGILILLKPNDARLNVMFQFCFKELLVQLHRDAAKNIVFGFTNARNTSFRPGETFNLLKKALAADPGIGIQLNRSTSYCFDSESFRCLAAWKNGVDVYDMGDDLDDFKISWKKSAEETMRLLEHFRPDTIVPHDVKSTLNLYRTRELVQCLTVPMADITKTINRNINLLIDDEAAIKHAIARGESWRGKLNITKIVYDVRQLDKPRTVCSDAACVEVKDDQKIHKSICHNDCNLSTVDVDTINCEELMQCYAFGCGKSMTCKVCGHRWQVHLHIRWEPVERTTEVEDEAVKLRIREAADERTVAETALKTRQNLIADYVKENRIIQKAAGQFSMYLKRSSLKPYNDSKLSYLDYLIDQEKGKVEAGGSPERLQDLREDRAQHEEEVRILTAYMKAGENEKLLDEQGINDLIAALFDLKVTGDELRKAAQKMQNIQRTAIESSKTSSAAVVPRRPSTMRHGTRPGASSGSSTRRGGALASSSGMRDLFKSVLGS